MLNGTRRGLAGLLAGFAGALAGAGALSATTPPQLRPTPGNSPPPADRLAILELIATYAWAYDCEDAALLRRTFTSDGVLEVFGNVLGTGKTGFEAMIAQAREMKAGHGWQHLTDHHVFRDYDGSHCKVYSYYTMAESDAQGGDVRMRAMGYYASDCVLTVQGWLFAKRSVARWTGKLPFAA